MKKSKKKIAFIVSILLVVILGFTIYSGFQQKNILEDEYKHVKFRRLFSSLCSWNHPFQFQFEAQEKGNGVLTGPIYDVTICQEFSLDNTESYRSFSIKNGL